MKSPHITNGLVFRFHYSYKSKTTPRGQEEGHYITFISSCPQQAILDFSRWWTERSTNAPEFFTRLLAVKCILIQIKSIDEDGRLPYGDVSHFYEWKCDTAGCPFGMNYRRQPGLGDPL